MPFTAANSRPGNLPDGYLAIPIDAGQLNASLQLCVLVASGNDTGAANLVLLRDAFDAHVYLGCIRDRSGRVDRWVELWVQNLENLDSAPQSTSESFSNTSLDRRWIRISAVMQQMPQSRFIASGWENIHPLPVLLDRKEQKPIHPVEPNSGRPWELCQDEAILAAHGAASFAASLHRYLFVPSLGDKSPLIAATPGAPGGDQVLPISTIAGQDKSRVPLNLAAGLLRVREFSPIDISAFLGLLSGKEPGGVGLVQSRLKLPASDPSQAHNGQWNRNAWLFIGQHGQRGRLLENFHIKLRLLADAVESVKQFVAAARQPVLTLSEDSFQVRIASGGAALPALWTARVELADPGDTIEINIPSSNVRRFQPVGARGSSIYNPALNFSIVTGRCDITVRKIIPETDNAVLVEGTIYTQERLGPVGISDLARFRLSAPLVGAEIYARLSSDTALAKGEWRFRSIPQRLDEQTLGRLRDAGGVVLRNIAFEILPMLSTPCDLNALGCLAVRTLLVNEKRSLPEALDEMMSLAREIAQTAKPGEAAPLSSRIGEIFRRDPRWREAMGPQWIVDEDLSHDQAMDLVPPELWWDTLAVIVKMFPGAGPDSICRDFGDAPPHALAKVFDPVLVDLDRLLVKSRSLIVIDWRYNREIHAVIRAQAMGFDSTRSKS